MFLKLFNGEHFWKYFLYTAIVTHSHVKNVYYVNLKPVRNFFTLLYLLLHKVD